jgi:hypothetical protein
MFVSGAKRWNNELSKDYKDCELLEKGIPLEWFPKKLLCYNLHKKQYKICPPTNQQIKEGFIGEKGKRRQIYAHRFTPGGAIRYLSPSDPIFETWIKKDSSKQNILEYGPYYHSCIWKGKIYEGKDYDIQPYYEKFDEQYYEIFLKEKEIEYKKYNEDKELIKIISWYSKNKDKEDVPKIALQHVEKKINDYEEFTDYMDKLRTLKDSEHKYKIIHSKMTYKKSWFI